MIIRKLCVNEIEQAVCLAQWTFEYCIMRRNANQQLKEIFMQYNNYENILSLFQQGRIMIWGAFEKNHMEGMGAMEAPGRITMLYVHPNCQRRGYGKALVREMQYVAYEEYKTEQISINVIPAWMAGYFLKRKFSSSRLFDMNRDLFVPMTIDTIKLKRYKQKKIKGKILAGIILGFVLLIIVSTLLFEFWYMY